MTCHDPGEPTKVNEEKCEEHDRETVIHEHLRS